MQYLFWYKSQHDFFLIYSRFYRWNIPCMIKLVARNCPAVSIFWQPMQPLRQINQILLGLFIRDHTFSYLRFSPYLGDWLPGICSSGAKRALLGGLQNHRPFSRANLRFSRMPVPLLLDKNRTYLYREQNSSIRAEWVRCGFSRAGTLAIEMKVPAVSDHQQWSRRLSTLNEWNYLESRLFGDIRRAVLTHTFQL